MCHPSILSFRAGVGYDPGMPERTSHSADHPDAIGPYQIKERIGVGGMGAVYRAHHARLSRSVALKRIHPTSAKDEKMRRYLRREARTGAQISHPNIAQVYDIIEAEGDDWIVMEYVEGRTLRRMLDAGPLDTTRVIHLGLDIAKGLAAAHAEGIVHRDLKAGNLIVTPGGQVKILDFGIALNSITADASPEMEGIFVGTPEVMSPEQALGHQVDHRSDLFSLGILLYEALSGRAPFHGSRSHETLRQICTQYQKPLRDIDPEIPQELVAIVDALLEKDPNDRLQSSEEVILALQDARGKKSHGPLKILFVDDEEDFEALIRQWYRRKIRAREVVLELARHGREALEKLREDPEIHLVFCDINMPEMDGLSLLEKIRKLDRNIVTVMVTAYDDMKNIRKAMNLGAFDFLVKPIDFQDLELTRQKATAEALRVRELLRLREDILLLEERNRFIRDTIARQSETGREVKGADHPGSQAQPTTVVELTVVESETPPPK